MGNYLSCTEKIFSEKCEKQLNFEVTLQEYLPNAVKIIRVASVPYIDECEITKDAVYVKGRIKLSALYLSDFKNRLKCALFTSEFNHTFPAAGIEEALSEDGFIDCHIASFDEKGTVLSPRKLSFSCKLHITPEAFTSKKNSIFDNNAENNLQKLCKKLDTMTVKKLQGCEFTVEESVSLDEGMPKIKEIVSSECTICSISSEISGENIKYRGELCFNCIYLGEDEADNGQYITFTKTLPFCAEAQLQENSGNAFPLCHGSITEVFADPARDNYGEAGLCSVRIGVLIDTKLYSCGETEAVSDVFSTKHDCECEIREVLYDSFAGGFSEEVHTSESIRTALGSITDIVCAGVTLTVVSCELPASSPVIGFRAVLRLCGTNESGGLEGLNTSFNFKTALTGKLCEIPEKCRFDALAHVKECSCRIENGEIKCDMVLEVNCAAYSRRSVRAVTAISADESSEVFRDKSEYIIYYPDKNDTVWSCAKKYRVAPEALLSVNGMNKTDTTFSGKRAVIIPRV